MLRARATLSPFRCRRCRVYTALCLLVFAAWFYVQGYPAYRAARFRHAWKTGDIETLNAMAEPDACMVIKDGRYHLLFVRDERGIFWGGKLHEKYFMERELSLKTNAWDALTGQYEFQIQFGIADDSIDPGVSISSGWVRIKRHQIKIYYAMGVE